MYEYLSDVIDQMKKGLALVGDRSYAIPVWCAVIYSVSDVYVLKSIGRVSDTFTIQDLAEEYFGVIINDLVVEFGAEEIKGFKFIVRGVVDETASASSIIMIVDYISATGKRKTDLEKKAREETYSYTQQKYVEDMISRSAKKYLNK